MANTNPLHSINLEDNIKHKLTFSLSKIPVYKTDAKQIFVSLSVALQASE